MHDPEIELAIEIHSAWGTFEWFLEEAFARGYRIGVCANSDGHKCRPGASYPGANRFGSYGGLTCVLAQALDRPSIINALKKRHCYATTGNRPLIDLRLDLNDTTFGMGDLVNIEGGPPQLNGQVVATAPIDYLEIRNGLQILEQIHPFGQEDLGCRVKILWSGARVRGRDRLVHWDGTLSLKNNAITKAEPINFWNAHNPLQRIDNQNLAWKSVTTGGIAGIILTLEHKQPGVLQIDTAQGEIEMDIASIGLDPMVWAFGGLKKEIKVYRLPDQPAPSTLTFSLSLLHLHKGDNPIFIHLVQEDGHMAWTSPAYLTLP
jgi:hypothetical protein